ncbi:MAG TPA: YjjG family noncanonical pyrimidine nucleotidase [Chitinophagales bacterium]|nr:YjjG family noncanonical pyrimidine nucleotidase [Chitinophagales bacterium]HNC34738.1 YjjG family noncanonical pyrimidine nucleotidase [Bacteroidia bacterium]HMX03766.1 YjjG family noncanonical pyrimidine nucleotidase [Chitinophagales bacterium]HMZ87916.1 YjjG family noncanonical pyrimidine nucleotidase [Chitinophagales bacterium]HNA56973.1 YjjG family noncanonical pyrimidine nucleotidase [Chitinophagales bacterium]
MQNIHHILFDLDNTLWDFSGNSKRILAQIHNDLSLDQYGIPDFHRFHEQYAFRNEYLWHQYALGNVTRDEVRLNRFYITFNDFGLDNYVLANKAADFYIHHTRKQTDLLPYTRELLDHLHGKYGLHIITNGFDEVQFFKLENTGIRHYFQTVTTAENAQSLKPNKKIFDHALSLIPAKASECLYIGDSPDVDGKGSIDAGMSFIWFNPAKKENKEGYREVQHLSEIAALL